MAEVLPRCGGTARDYMARRRPQIRVEEGRGRSRVFIPQSHRPGVDAEVDFGDVYVKLADVSHRAGSTAPLRTRACLLL
ncbi:hypothetical protein [Streptomyces sp. NPDC002328]|uniref:hypothetical protein n=1 Tax=Streptomyces sp. NPDC002328 TaxID=3364642 RepID=UPI0036B69361